VSNRNKKNNINKDNNKNININKNNNKDISNKEIVVELKKEINNSNNKVVKVVNKALNKASTLISYLMEHHSTTPPLRKLRQSKCIKTLRLNYKCEIDKNKDYDYELELLLINDHSKNKFVKNISKTILNLVNHKTDQQPIYNTDSSRQTYVIKTTNKWNEDIAGVKFTELVIKPLLTYIGDLIKNYRITKLDTVNMYKNNLEQNTVHLEQMSKTLNLETDIINDKLVKPILRELTPYLRFLEEELEEMEKLEELEEIQEELDYIVATRKLQEKNKIKDISNDSDGDGNNSCDTYSVKSSDDSDYDSEEELQRFIEMKKRTSRKYREYIK